MAANKLSDAKAKRLTTPGVYADGAGLYLQVTMGKAGDVRRSWFVRLRLPEGRSRDMGLGTFELVPLAAARAKAQAARIEAKAGRDPLVARETEKLQAKVDAARALTFRQAAEAAIEPYARDLGLDRSYVVYCNVRMHLDTEHETDGWVPYGVNYNNIRTQRELDNVNSTT
jgi:hypothetical protein